jgi:hypothetical protein
VGGNLSNRNWLIPGAGTNTFADGLYSYVIGSSANQTGFSKTGSYTSDVIDFENRPYSFANLTINYVLPDSSSTFLTIETRTSDTGSLDPEDEDAWTNWSAVTNEHVFADKHTFSINSMPERYVQVRISFSSADQIFSPRVDDYSIFYYEDIEQPTGPTHVTAYRSDQKPLPEITNPTDPEHPIGQAWFGDTAPCFEWPAAGEPNGASDNPNPGGSGIAGYYVYFGENAAGEPLAFQEENSFTAPSLNATNDSGKTYYLRVQAVDNAGLPAAEIYNAFVYNFDRTPPTNPTDISVNPLGYSSTDTYTFTWTPDAADASSQVKMFQYRTDGDEVEVWHDIPDPETVSQTAGPYQANKNTFYLRTIDNADNASAAITQDYYWSGGAASPPENLTVFPSDAENTDNSFTLTWDLPASFAGEAAKLKYYYSINALPTAYNTVETTVRAAGPGPFATQYGKNTFYVVALNDGGTKTNPTDIDWNNPAEVDFYAKTTAPGAPLNTAIFDTSDRENAEYSVRLNGVLRKA